MSLASHVPWGIVVFAIIIITTIIFILLERAFYHFVTQLSMGKNLGYFGGFHQLLESFGLWVASVWTAICGCGVSGELTEASPPPPYHVSLLPSISFTASPSMQQTMALTNYVAREDEKINIIV